MFRRPHQFFWSQAESRSDVVRAKVKWADHHHRLLADAVTKFRDSKPYLVNEDRRSWDGGDYDVVSAQPFPAPDDIGLILTDYIQNLRSALDYLVGAMRVDGPSRNSSFPLCLSRPLGPHGFRERQCIALRGIPNEAVKLIHWMQPYHRGQRRSGDLRDALRALEVLWNVSKHRTLLVVASRTRPYYVGRDRADEQAPSIAFRMRLPDDSSEIWLPVTSDEKFDPHFSVHVSLAKPRGFANDWPDWIEEWEVDGLVDYLYRVVAQEVIPRFDEFIQQGAHLERPVG
jgi:hypothetical protein